MLYGELSEFTWGELSNFTCEELSMDALELLKKVKDDNRPLPISVIEKLQGLCENLSKESELKEKIPAEITKSQEKMTFKEFAERLNFIIMLLKAIPELYEKYSPIIKNIINAIRTLK